MPMFMNCPWCNAKLIVISLEKRKPETCPACDSTFFVIARGDTRGADYSRLNPGQWRELGPAQLPPPTC